MPLPAVTQREIAQELRLSIRQVRNLTDEGVLVRDKDLKYDVADNFAKFLAYREAQARNKGSATKEELLLLQRRKLEQELTTGELALAQQLERLVTLEYMQKQVSALLEALRARCLNVPGKWAVDVAQASTPGEAQDLLERMITDLLSELAEAGDDPELDADDEEPGAPDDPPNS